MTDTLVFVCCFRTVGFLSFCFVVKVKAQLILKLRISIPWNQSIQHQHSFHLLPLASQLPFRQGLASIEQLLKHLIAAKQGNLSPAQNDFELLVITFRPSSDNPSHLFQAFDVGHIKGYSPARVAGFIERATSIIFQFTSVTCAGHDSTFSQQEWKGEQQKSLPYLWQVL